MKNSILQIINYFYNNIDVFDKNKKIDYLVILFIIIYILHQKGILVLNTDLIIKPLLSLVVDRGIVKIFLKLINFEKYLQTNIKIKYFSNPKMNLISEYGLINLKILVLPYGIYKIYLKCIEELSYNIIIISIIPYLIIAFYINSIQKK
jgi:hypothetical protein